jgi:hypothetical protein
VRLETIPKSSGRKIQILKEGNPKPGEAKSNFFSAENLSISMACGPIQAYFPSPLVLRRPFGASRDESGGALVSGAAAAPWLAHPAAGEPARLVTLRWRMTAAMRIAVQTGKDQSTLLPLREFDDI